VTLVSAGQAGFVGCVGVELVDGIPERRQGRLPACVVPDARCNHTAVACDPCHLGQSAYWIGHEMNDELGEGRVELGIVKWQLFSGRDAYLNPRMALSGCGNELL
jgi:hypothetical protein